MKDDNKNRTSEKTTYSPGKGAGTDEQRHVQERKSNEGSVKNPGTGAGNKNKDDRR